MRRPNDLADLGSNSNGDRNMFNHYQSSIADFHYHPVGDRVVRWCWVNFQCRGVLQFGLE